MLRKPSYVDLILTNKSRSFQNFCTFKTGLSDFHKMTLTVLKSSFAKQKPRILNYRNYNSLTSLQRSILYKLINSNLQISNKDLKHFKETCLSVVNTIAPLKSRFIRANQAPFINKEIQRGVMVKSKLRKKFLKSRSESDKKAFNKQRNKCVSLLRKTKKAYYWNKVSSLINQTILKIYLLLKTATCSPMILKLQKLSTNIFKLQILKYQAIFFAEHQKMAIKFQLQYTNTKIIQVSK